MNDYYQLLETKGELVRRWPYPYTAGLSISNDIEYMSLEFFQVLMEFLNTENETSLGKGVGLSISSSVFFFNFRDYNFSYFDGLAPDAPNSQNAHVIRDYIESGWIDTIHAYGDFDWVGGFCREHAERVLVELSQYGLRVPIFTNHGTVDNVQNIGMDVGYHQGDVLGGEAYHADLLSSMGIKYVWTDSLVTWRELDKTRLEKVKGLAKGVRNWVKGIKNRDDTQLIQDVPLNDGSFVKGFLRFRSTGDNAPNFTSLPYQINQINWDQFYADQGAIILYQHLGVLERLARQCTQASVESIMSGRQYLLSPFYFLQDQMRLGKLWVPVLSELLTYVDMVNSVLIKRDKDIYEICFREGEYSIWGLTVYIDSLKPVKLVCGGEEIQYRFNGPDETGRYSVTVPFPNRPDIWN